MKYRRLGKSGLQVSALSFGSWVTFAQQIGNDVASDCMKAAYEAGVNFFDNAEGYAEGKSEIVMGEILKKFGWARDTFLVLSKVFFGGSKPNQSGLCRKHVFEACHAALKRLQVEHLDLYFCHRPDPNTPIEETVRAMDQLIMQGKVLYWGTSQWSAQEIMQAHSIARECHLTPPTMEQPEYSIFCRYRVEREYRRLYSEVGLGTTIWSPLALGLLTGKYRNGVPGDTRATLKGYEWLLERMTDEEAKKKMVIVDGLGKIAGELGISLPKFALAWCLKNPNVSTVITGASKVEQVRENMEAVDCVDLLTEEVMKRVEEFETDGALKMGI